MNSPDGRAADAAADNDAADNDAAGNDAAGNGGAETDEFAWLFSLQRFGIKPGLETTVELLAAVGSPQAGMNVVLVAGTNGKGSVATVLAACLDAAGHRTGSYFSPHLQRLGERVRVAGVEATDDELRGVLAQLRPHALRLKATFFEVMTVAALLRFREAEVQWAVLEVGLGGRLDATNALEPALSLITAVGLDHTAVLGPDIATIAAEKAGIIRSGVPLLTSADGVALEVIERRAALIGAPLVALPRDVTVDLLAHDWDGITLSIEVPAKLPAAAVSGSPTRRPAAATGATLLRLRSPLIGLHQTQNVALAALAALSTGVDAEAVKLGVAGASWPGRLEVIEFQGRRFVLDGAHNPQAAQALAAAVGALEAEVEVLILGISGDKDAAGVLGPLASLAKRLLVTRAEHSPRAADPQELLTQLRQLHAPADDATAVTGPLAALDAALSSTKPGDVVVVAGSLFLVGEFRSLLTGAISEGVQRWQ